MQARITLHVLLCNSTARLLQVPWVMACRSVMCVLHNSISFDHNRHLLCTAWLQYTEQRRYKTSGRYITPSTVTCISKITGTGHILQNIFRLVFLTKNRIMESLWTNFVSPVLSLYPKLTVNALIIFVLPVFHSSLYPLHSTLLPYTEELDHRFDKYDCTVGETAMETTIRYTIDETCEM
jgi:hypothetical protein